MGEDETALDKKKSHRARHSGVKAEKKRLKKKQPEENLTARQRNPKAFAINSTIRAERQFRRKEDLTAKKQHIPLIDQTPDEPPPVLIAVVGPPKVGKSTLINNLIKNFTKTNVNDVKGPITIVTSKKRRITLIECNNDINSMIDIAKCADLVLLLCDASFGFEMEIFEFLNICQVHGMPKIMGVLTHLDMIKNAKTLKRRKKELKHRFWTEVYDGAKLFYLSGIIHGEYLRNEIKNLGRFISVMKFRPLTWRGAHSYVLVDRVEDITNTEMIRQNPKCDRNVVLYGYMRGVPMNKSHMVHVAGVGDLRLHELNALPDPCPLPGTEKKRSLLEKERLLYAPMSGVGGLVYDKDALYIELQGSHSHRDKTNVNPEQEELVTKLIEKKQTVDQQVEEQEFRLFSDGALIKSKNFIDKRELSDQEDGNEESSDDEESEIDSGLEENSNEENDEKSLGWQGNSDNEDIAGEEESEEESSDEEYQEEIEKNENSEEDNFDESDNDEMDGKNEIENANMAWKEGLTQKAREAYFQRQSESKNLMKLVYGVYSKV